MTTHLMSARRSAFMGRAISSTASSWAWARGPVGVTATAGATIASTAAAADGTTAAVVLRLIVLMRPMAVAQAARHATPAGLTPGARPATPTQPYRMAYQVADLTAEVVADLTAEVAADLTAEVAADLTAEVAADPMAVASTANR